MIRSLKQPRPLPQGGFTVPELIVMMVVTTILTTLVIDFSLNFWKSVATLENDSDALVTRMNSGDKLRDALNASSGLINQNSIADTNTGNADPAIVSGQYWVPVHAIPGNTPIGGSGIIVPVIYYMAPSLDASKNYIMNGTQPYNDEFVLYLNGTTKQLLLRSLANSSASGNKLVTSCPAAIASASCPADRIVAGDVSSVDLRYFSRSGNTIDYTSVVDPLTGNYIGPDFSSVEVVEITVHLYHKSTIHNGADTVNEVIVRVALRNS